MRRLLVLTLLAGAVYVSAQTPFPRLALPAREPLPLSAARNWGYQLQNARADRIAAGIDMLVIDAQRPSGTQRVLTAEEVERFRTRPDGRKRIVLAYLSIGEAENYRSYWWSHWRVAPPAWLSTENQTWKSNFRVRYWHPGWQRLMVEPAPSLLDRGIDLVSPQQRPALDQIIDAGFDGVYLDRVDAFYEWQKTRPTAEADMMAFVKTISDYAKRRRPGFLIVPQNAEELLANADYRRRIDGIAKEDLLFGSDHRSDENKPDEVSETIRFLNMARADRLPVFVVEYIAAPEKRQQATSRVDTLGYILQFADRALKAPPEPPPREGGMRPQPTNDAPRPQPVRPKGSAG